MWLKCKKLGHAWSQIFVFINGCAVQNLIKRNPVLNPIFLQAGKNPKEVVWIVERVVLPPVPVRLLSCCPPRCLPAGLGLPWPCLHLQQVAESEERQRHSATYGTLLTLLDVYIAT